jgi:molecular chaperone GrpE
MATLKNHNSTQRSTTVTKDSILEPEDVTNEQNHELEETPEAVQGEAAPQPAQEKESLADQVAALRQDLAETKAKETEYLDGWQRARAELSNARKRFQRDQEQAYTNARADVLTRLLPIVDDFERARNTLPDDLSRLTWIEGVLLIQRKLQALLDQDGVVPIQAVGEKFDPFLHQAITHEPSAAVPEGHVIDEMQRGYRLGDRVLRPSMVRVSSGPAEVEVKAEVKAEAKAETQE